MWKTPFFLLALLAAVSSTIADARANEVMNCRGGGMTVSPPAPNGMVFIMFNEGANAAQLNPGQCAWATRRFGREPRRLGFHLSTPGAHGLIDAARNGSVAFTVRASLTGMDYILVTSLLTVRAAGTAGSSQCATYAQSAIQQVRAAASSRCGFTGSRWSTDEGVHYRFCTDHDDRRQRAKKLAEETNLRATALTQCKMTRHF